MSQVMSVDENEVQYVLNDAEFVLDPLEINSEGLSDIIYSDGTRAILVNGHGQIIQGEAQTVVLQDGDDLSQYYINDENGQILVADDQDASISQTLDGTEIVQYIDEDENTTEEPQVIYVNEEGFAIQDSDLSEYQVTEPQEGENEFPLKTIKLETQVVDLEELIRQQGEGETAIIENLNDENRYQYAILKDGKLHIQSYTGEVFPITSTEEAQEEQNPFQKDLTEQQILDLSKITGRNLLTGQTVTLHSYMDKLQKKIKNPFPKDNSSDDSSSKKRKLKHYDGLKALLNKKLTIGKTSSGKRLVGKIIRVEKKESSAVDSSINFEQTVNYIAEETSSELNNDEDVVNVMENCMDLVNESSCNDSTETEQQESDSNMVILDQSASELTNHISKKKTLESHPDKRKIVIHEKIVSKECFGHISRTLSGLMNMDSVKKKLQYKNIIVKVVEKKYIPSTKTYTKNVSYSSGYMQDGFTLNHTGETIENWYFVPDPNTKEAIFGKSTEDDEDSNQETHKYMETINVTLMITQGKSYERIMQVILNPTNNNKCTVCSREFRSHLQLRVHINNAHRTNDGFKTCQICSEKFDDYNAIQEHRQVHVEEGKLFQCLVKGCGKFFLTAGRLRRHSTVHNVALRPLECSVCLHRCSSESGLKKHLMTHMNIKPFYCTTCGKSFSNPGDLNFHKRIHDPCKYYACEFCKRTFSRHSNLQRHVEIHKGSGELFQCSICGCSYHYMSSLTRHVVQNHVKRPASTEAAETAVENEADSL